MAHQLYGHYMIVGLLLGIVLISLLLVVINGKTVVMIVFKRDVTLPVCGMAVKETIC